MDEGPTLPPQVPVVRYWPLVLPLGLTSNPPPPPQRMVVRYWP